MATPKLNIPTSSIPYIVHIEEERRTVAPATLCVRQVATNGQWRAGGRFDDHAIREGLFLVPES